jgi:hypothetical protein
VAVAPVSQIVETPNGWPVRLFDPAGESVRVQYTGA